MPVPGKDAAAKIFLKGFPFHPFHKIWPISELGHFPLFFRRSVLLGIVASFPFPIFKIS
jgi:hypothetical protein